MMEVWKDIPSLDGWYQASNLGRIRSLRRRRGAPGKSYKPNLLSPRPNKGHGYTMVSISMGGGKRKMKLLHRLIAEAFIPNPENKRTVNHKDGNKENNRIDNLEWATYSENQLHAYENDLCPKKRGESHPMAKLSVSDVLEIRKAEEEGSSTEMKMSETYGVTTRTINDVVNRRTWIHI